MIAPLYSQEHLHPSFGSPSSASHVFHLCPDPTQNVGGGVQAAQSDYEKREMPPKTRLEPFELLGCGRRVAQRIGDVVPCGSCVQSFRDSTFRSFELEQVERDEVDDEQ